TRTPPPAPPPLADTTLFRSRYDIVVTQQGPPRKTVVRRKERVLGMWVNVESKTFENVPESYSMATTRATQDIAGDEGFRSLALGDRKSTRLKSSYVKMSFAA